MNEVAPKDNVSIPLTIPGVARKSTMDRGGDGWPEVAGTRREAGSRVFAACPYPIWTLEVFLGDGGAPVCG